MNTKLMSKIVTAAAATAMAAMAIQPAAAYPLNPTGQTLASPRLVADVLGTIGQLSKATGGCVFVFSANMRIMPRSYAPMRPTISATARGGHYEMWTINACGAKQRFQIGMWPSPRGGSDYAVTPLTGRMPLYTR